MKTEQTNLSPSSASDLPFWLVGVLFLLVGLVLAFASLPSMLAYIDWSGATNTTGRVIVTEWARIDGQNRLKIGYAYKDESGTIYHTTGVIGRALGKINLEPGAGIAVLYRADDHARSRLAMEVGSADWLPVMIIAAVQIAFAGFCLAAAVRRRQVRMSIVSGAGGAAVKNDNTPV